MPFIQESLGTPGAGEENHIRLLRALASAVGSIHATSVAIVAGGAGYVVGDVVQLTGAGSGTPLSQSGMTFPLRAIVTSESGGVVDGIRLESAGAYTTSPDVTAASIATTGGTGAGLTLSVTVEGPYEATPVAGGSGYVVGDLITVDDFTGSVDPTFRVTAESGGAVTALVQATLGDFAFDEIPGSTSATSGGTGTGLTVDIEQVGWKTQRRDDVDDETDFEWIARGTNLAGSHPYIGIRTGTSAGNPMWNLIGASGFNDASPFGSQPGISPSAWSSPGSAGGARIPLATGGTFEMFIAVTGRRIIGVLRQTPAYEMFYLGLLNPFVDDPANKWPLPLLVSGTTGRDSEDISTAYNNATSPHAALPQHGSPAIANIYMYRWIDGTWRQLAISTSADDNYLWPYRSTADLNRPNNVSLPVNPNGGFFAVSLQGAGPEDSIGDDIFNSLGGLRGFSPLPFGVGNQTHPTIPMLIINDIEASGVSQIVGELDGVFHINGEDVAAEDRVSLSTGQVAAIFSNINSSANDRFYAVLEE